MAIVGFDYGHGGRDPGAVYKGRREADDVLKVGMKTARILRNHGVTVDETRTTDKTLSLTQRSDFFNRKSYDYVVSFHRNAFDGTATGVEVYAYPTAHPKSKRLSKRMNDELVKIGFVNRGAKLANFHMVRVPKAFAVLPEIGFIDNPRDNKIFDDNIDEIAEAIAKSILVELGMNYKGGNVKPNIKPPTSKPIKPSPKPSNKPSSNKIAVDGYWGRDTSRALQRALRTPVDGIISGQYSTATTRSITGGVSFAHRRGSTMVRALQRKIGVKVDGLLGPNTVRGLQRYLGTYQDGIISRPSPMVKELQRRLNNGTF